MLRNYFEIIKYILEVSIESEVLQAKLQASYTISEIKIIKSHLKGTHKETAKSGSFAMHTMLCKQLTENIKTITIQKYIKAYS